MTLLEIADRSLRHTDRLSRPRPSELQEVMLVINDGGADGNVRSAMLRLSAMARIRADSHDKVGWGPHWIAEELSRRILLVLV